MLRFTWLLHTTATLSGDQSMALAAGGCEGCGDGAARALTHTPPPGFGSSHGMCEDRQRTE